MYVYVESEPGLYTVGHYSPTGKWHPDSDHSEKEAAAARVAWLNGGPGPTPRLKVTTVWADGEFEAIEAGGITRAEFYEDLKQIGLEFEKPAEGRRKEEKAGP